MRNGKIPSTLNSLFHEDTPTSLPTSASLYKNEYKNEEENDNGSGDGYKDKSEDSGEGGGEYKNEGIPLQQSRRRTELTVPRYQFSRTPSVEYHTLPKYQIMR